MQQGDYVPQYKKYQYEFHQSIRRKQIESIFSDRRWKLMQQMNAKEQQDLQAMLDTPQKRKEWLDKHALEMAGEPNPQWRQCLQNLSLSLQVFKGDFDDWLTTGIIKGLIDLMTQRYKDLQLGPQAAQLLSNVIYLGQKCERNLIKKILEYEFLEEVVSLCEDLSNSHSVSLYFQLLGNIASFSCQARDRVVRAGAIPLLKRWGETLQTEGTDIDEVRILLITIQSVCRSYEQQRPKFGINPLFIPMVAYHLESLSLSIVRECLLCVYYMLKSSRENIYSNVFHHPGLRVRILKLIRHEEFEIRKFALACISHLLNSQMPAMGAQVIQDGILDTLAACVQMKRSEDTYMMQSMINTINNLISFENVQTSEVVRHPVFEIVINGTHSRQKLATKKDALYCLSSIMAKEDFSVDEYLIAKFNVLEILMLGINEMDKMDADSIVEILRSLEYLIRTYANVYYNGNNSNKIVDILQHIYNFTTIISNIHQSHKNKMIVTRASVIIDLIYTTA